MIFTINQLVYCLSRNYKKVSEVQRAQSSSKMFFLFFWILKFKHLFLVQSEAEEVRQVLWLSVVLYKSPESELTCCLLLSNDTIYFLLEDSASSLGHHSGRTN